MTSPIESNQSKAGTAAYSAEVDAYHRRVAMSFGLLALLLFMWAAFSASVSAQSESATVDGRVTVSAEIDDTDNYGGIEVIVVDRTQTGIDTLGYAETRRDGYFEMDVTAPRRDVYPIVLRRHDQTVAAADIVIADGENASFEVELPDLRGLARIRSNENSAWMSYRNIEEQHNQQMTQHLTGDLESTDQFERNIRQTATIFWSLRDSFPGTLGAEMASAEALIMMSGWDDEFVLERLDEISPDNPRYVDVARVAHQSARNVHGADESLSILRDMKDQAYEHQRSEIQAQIVLALIAADRSDDAIAEARQLEAEYGHIEGWSDWVDNVSYELENLQPGMQAPDFSLTTQEGEELTRNGLQGDLVVLEFYHPRDGTFARQIEARRALTELAEEEALTIVAISLEPDPSMNEAFLDGRNVGGHHVFLEEGGEAEIVNRYNVRTLPTRVLIDQEGNIRQKYMGGTLPALQEEIVALLYQNGQ